MDSTTNMNNCRKLSNLPNNLNARNNRIDRNAEIADPPLAAPPDANSITISIIDTTTIIKSNLFQLSLKYAFGPRPINFNTASNKK